MTLESISIHSENEKISKLLNELNPLIAELNERNLSEDLYAKIESELQSIRKISADNEKGLKSSLKKARGRILKLLEKEVKLVPKGYYQNLYIAIGMTAFGMPLGVAFGVALNNMAFLGIGLPIGLAIGLAIGKEKDKKAEAEGRQLNTEISY